MPKVDVETPVIIIGAIVGGLGLLVGLIAAGAGSSTGQTGSQQAIAWESLPQPAATVAADIGIAPTDVAQRLLDSGFFGTPPDTLALAEQDNDTGRTTNGQAERSGFPEIVAAAYVDGVPTVYLRDSDGSVRAWGEGSRPSENWRILEITLNVVRAQYEDEPAETFRVFADKLLPDEEAGTENGVNAKAGRD